MQHNLDLGQHFMTDETLLQRIASSLVLNSDDILLEIGSGSGNLTKHLLSLTKQLICVEYDSRLPSPDPAVTYIQGNALDVLPDISADVVVGNMPYHICEPLFLKLLDLSPKQIVAVTGLTFAKKLQDQTSIGFYVRNCYEVELKEVIGPEAFSPPPKVQSALLVLTKKSCASPLLEELRLRPKQKVKNSLLALCRTKTKNEIRELLSSYSWADKPLYQLSDVEFTQLHQLLTQIE